MAYKQFPIIEVDLEALLLDLDNYRIPTRSTSSDGALKYLFASEDVLGQARDFLRTPYFDNEVPIVMEAPEQLGGQEYIVLEGNRRVSALKGLHNPGIIPAHEKELRALLKRYAVEAGDLPTRIRVIVAPDRETAAPHIARLHTGVPKRRWTRDQQANFYYSLLDSRTTVADIKTAYPSVRVANFMKMAVMRRFLVAAKFEDASLHDYVSSPELTMSAFEYAYKIKEISDAIGVEFDKDGLLVPRSSSPEKIAENLPKGNLRALEYLVQRFRNAANPRKALNTRSPEFKKDTEERANLISMLQALASGEDCSGNDAVVTSSKSSTQAIQTATEKHVKQVAHTVSPPTESVEVTGNRGPNHPDTKDHLDLSGLDYENVPVSLKCRYQELRKISLRDLPMASAILMRSVLETTIKYHYEGTSTQATGQLKDIIGQVYLTYGNDKPLKTCLNTIRSGEQKPGSVVWFNLIAHSLNETTTATEVRQAWLVVNPVLRRLLQPQTQLES